MAKRDPGRKRVGKKTQFGLGVFFLIFAVTVTNVVIDFFFDVAGLEQTILTFLIHAFVSAIGVGLILWSIGLKQSLRRT